jgi:hypothetical protein
MNTNTLKKFAQEARKKLISQIGAKLELVLTSDSAELREKASQIKKLQEAINTSSKEQVIDTVAYTWFNRLMALRFMDANDYQPIGMRVVTPKDSYTLPEILDEAKQGNIPDELPINQQHVYDVLDGRVPATNAQNEAYKELLIGACNHLNKVFPFLFEKLSDYSELLLPDDLISEFSIIQDVKDGMTAEDCQDVEIIGWLYQFYISERKDELINAKKRYKADEIAPVTQLFTPKWIVQYMVDNTLGQLWKEARPNATITNGLEFYIKPNNPELIPSRDLKSVEDITFFDPCVGSAHVLCYAYDIFYKMYEEEGYNPSDIPELILTKNLFGIDIDDRAAQLASFALMMKGRKNHRRFFGKNIVPNITAFQNIESHPKFENAKVLGSLIKITKQEVHDIKIDETSLFVKRDIQLKKQASLLADKYDIIVTNPPYLNSSYMEGSLKQFVENEYKTTKADLFACFLAQVSNFTKEDGLIGFICPYVWMFINKYQWLRENTIDKTTISSLIQLEYNAFGPAVVPIGTFVLRNKFTTDYEGSYVKLSEFTGADNQAPRTLEAIDNPKCGWFYTANQKDFENIPGSLIGYWKTKHAISIFEKGQLSEVLITREGMATAGNDRFMRIWSETSMDKTNFECESFNKRVKWYPYNKGGSFKRWYGNDFFIVNWENDGYDIRNNRDRKTGRLRSHNYNGEYSFQKGITWTALTSGKFSARWTEKGYLFDSKGAKGFYENDGYKIIGLLNSSIAQFYLDVLAPTLDYKVGDIIQVPYFKFESETIDKIVKECILLSKIDWNSRETSWNFVQNELIKHKSQNLEETFDLYQQYWKNKFFQLHKNEEELNKQFIGIYGLQNELTPEVSLEDITILKEETKIVNNQLVFQAREVFAQFMSYAVGCMFGRYSLDKEGLILANQGETLEDYLKKVEKSEDALSFLPDDDNIIPILDDEWFEDDIVNRFNEFLKVTFGKPNFEKNLAFVEECLGKDVRKYFVKDFYADHKKRYKTRPIYWMFSSPKGSFNVLIYMHRYTPDTLNQILNGYLKEYREKLNTHIEHLDHIIVSGSSSVQTKASKEKDKLKLVIIELLEYERDVLYPLATERIAIDLDDGVLVNYNKFGTAIKKVAGLNDKKAKDKVLNFDWIDTSEIR